MRTENIYREKRMNEYKNNINIHVYRLQRKENKE